MAKKPINERCAAEAEGQPNDFLIAPCDELAVGERLMICKSGYEELPLLPACEAHMAQQEPPIMWEDWG